MFWSVPSLREIGSEWKMSNPNLPHHSTNVRRKKREKNSIPGKTGDALNLNLKMNDSNLDLYPRK
jgi:hypothetical protein